MSDEPTGSLFWQPIVFDGPAGFQANDQQRVIFRSLYKHRRDLILKGLTPRYVVLDQATYRAVVTLALVNRPDAELFKLESMFGLPVVVIPGIPELCTVVADPWEEARRGVDINAADVPSYRAD